MVVGVSIANEYSFRNILFKLTHKKEGAEMKKTKKQENSPHKETIILDNSIITKKDTMFTVCILFIPILVMLSWATHLCNSNLIYTLDDPYIHLELAKNIMLGNYGININEFSAPSSSILWPFLLAPFSLLPLEYYEIIPFILNTIFALFTGILLVNIFSEAGKALSIVIAFIIMMATNVYGVIFTGMEHSLQILLVVGCIYFLLNLQKFEQMSYRFLFYICLFLLPLVRYEGLAVSIPTLIYVYLQEREREGACI